MFTLLVVVSGMGKLGFLCTDLIPAALGWVQLLPCYLDERDLWQGPSQSHIASGRA